MFPLHQVTQQVAINLNGQRLTSVPRDTLQARSRFWPQDKLNQILVDCPVQKQPTAVTLSSAELVYKPTQDLGNAAPNPLNTIGMGYKSSNNIGLTTLTYTYDATSATYTITAQWNIEEPILCSPFNSNLFEPYGKPIWNISSLEITYWMENLNRMLALTRGQTTSTTPPVITTSISNPVLNFKVANTDLPPPATFLSPYYEYVPFLTEQTSSAEVPYGQVFNITSGV